MTYIFGDLHGNACGELSFLNSKKFPEQRHLTKKDILFQLGDFGYLWYYPEITPLYKKDMNAIGELADKNFTTIIVPGNHENYDLIETFPIIKKFGGKVREIKTKKGSVYIALRGEVYTINGEKYFTFGGAISTDIKDRISKKKWKDSQSNKLRKNRIKKSKISWWEQEIPSKEEFEYGFQNLKKHNFEIDYILTHTAPISVLKQIMLLDKNKLYDPTAFMLEKFKNKTKFKKWFFGHIHSNEVIEDKFISHYMKKPLLVSE